MGLNRAKCDIDCKNGTETLFTCEEKRKLADPFVFKANIGYGYSVTYVRCMVADFARSLEKNVRAKGELSSDWFYGYRVFLLFKTRGPSGPKALTWEQKELDYSETRDVFVRNTMPPIAPLGNKISIYHLAGLNIISL